MMAPAVAARIIWFLPGTLVSLGMRGRDELPHRSQSRSARRAETLDRHPACEAAARSAAYVARNDEISAPVAAQVAPVQAERSRRL